MKIEKELIVKRAKYASRGEYHLLSFEEVGWGGKRKRIIREQNNTCNKCKNFEWLGFPIILEIDHIDGNRNNNLRENLEGLCPNCHSTTGTWRGRRGSSPFNWESKKELIL